MNESPKPPVPERWAQLRFSVVGPLLAAPPPPGELEAALAALADKSWLHPVTGAPTQFGRSTIERWFHQARRAADPVGALRRKLRKDAGQQTAVGEPLRQALLQQYADHPSWSVALHYGNLAALVRAEAGLGPLPSYASIRRFMKAHGLPKRRRFPNTPGGRRAAARLEQREVRSFEADYVHGLWHLDFHHGAKKVLTPAGEWVTPLLLGVLDDRSRLACHVQWYLGEETAEHLVHGLAQALQKRGLPRSLMTDNGAAMTAAELTQGLTRLGIVHCPTLPHSPYQNAKQEVFWAQVEGRLVAMLEGVADLTLALLNDATQAWVEMEYHRTVHSETRQSPLERFAQGPDVGRACPDSAALRLAFTTAEQRMQRRSDGTVTLNGQRFEIPARYRPLTRVAVRYASWDLTHVHLVDERTGTVLARLFPLDKSQHADGRRRTLPPSVLDGVAPAAPSGIAPLLRQLMTDYAATGLPPAYLPRPETPESDPRPDPSPAEAS